jgi:hypothetical protein
MTTTAGKHRMTALRLVALVCASFADWHCYGKGTRRKFDALPYPEAKYPIDWSAP